MINAFLYGTTLAIGLIIPLGVQNVFIFNQGATQPHFLHALPSVLTAFICDMCLILCAVFGVSLIVLTIPWLKSLIFGVGIIFLFYMALLTWKNANSATVVKAPFSAKKQIGFAASVSLLNPHALLDSIAVIGVNALQFSGSNKLAFTVACIIVSFCWFLSLSIMGHYLNKIDASGHYVKIINKISAGIILSIACYLAYQLLIMFIL